MWQGMSLKSERNNPLFNILLHTQSIEYLGCITLVQGLVMRTKFLGLGKMDDFWLFHCVWVSFFSSKIIKQVFSCYFFPLVGTIGAFLNCLVLIGVGGNARLGTTVNRLLTWICVIALMESTVGITVKSLILG